MANEIWISKSNPVKLVEMDPVEIPQYLTRHFHVYLLVEQLRAHPAIQRSLYSQIYQTSDTIKMQISSEFTPISMSLIDKRGVQFGAVNFNNIGINIYRPEQFILESSIPLVSIPPGCYFLQVIAGTTGPIKRFISEPISIKVKHPGSILFQYRNSRYKDDILYETGIEFQFRVQGEILYDKQGLKRYGYQSQNLSQKLLNSTDYEIYDLTVGGPPGIPAWVQMKTSKIMGHNEVKIDGIYFTGVDDFEIEQKTEDGTWMRGVKMKVVEGLNRSSLLYLGVGNPNTSLIIVHQVDESVIFGSLDQDGTTTIPVISIN